MRYRDEFDDSELTIYARALNQRAKSLDAHGELTAALLLDCILSSGGRCGWCDESVVNSEFEIDHIFSLSAGGENTSENIILACPACNRSKGEMSPVRFAMQTVARTGYKTPLINRLLSRYDGDVYVQRRMFEDVPDTTPHHDEPPEDHPSTIPPYTWS